MDDICEVTRAFLENFRPNASEFSVLWASENLGKDPFLILVSVVLSQNTSDINSIRALKNLLEKGVTSPDKLLSLDEGELIQAVKIAGQYRSRVRSLRALAAFFLSNPEAARGLCLDVEASRKELMKVWGIGEKTVDVFLSIYCETSEVFPVDRHIMRITSRLLGRKVGYKEASSFWLRCGSDKSLKGSYALHAFLIDLGRRVCRPRNPLCGRCVFSQYCSYGKGVHTR